jgi:ubiquinone/menaquinone biosynthesis C-methylase UbiE
VKPLYSFDDATAYERYMGRWSAANGPVFLEWLGAPPNARWLDVGCGTGIFTEIILDKASPRSLAAVDPSAAQIEHARKTPAGQRVRFEVADAQALPFADGSFDVVASSLVLNFIPDPAKAVREMRRVAGPKAVVAGFVWDFAAGLNPNWPIRRALEQLGHTAPPVPGTEGSRLPALRDLFGQAGFEDVAVRTIEVTQSYDDFDDFWQAQTPGYNPPTKIITALPESELARLKDIVRGLVPAERDGRIRYSARSNAVKGRVAG